MQQKPIAPTLTPSQSWIIAAMSSFALHLATGGGLSAFVSSPPRNIQSAVKIKISSSAESTKVVEAEKPIPKKTKPPRDKVAPNLSRDVKASDTATPVQGLTKESFGADGAISAPRGNTMMTGDTGQRLSDVDNLKGDLSQPARLIPSSLVTPPYTDEALDAGLEGTFVVDVFVNLDGSVREAELRKKIGYGMDQRVLNSVKSSKFVPRRNKNGVSEAGWAELKFTLLIP